MKTVELNSNHKTARSLFDCENKALNTFISTQSGQHSKLDVAKTWALVSEQGELIGFYSLSAMLIDCGELPKTVIKKYPNYQFLPAALLGRIAVDKKYKGKGYGKLLLMDAIHRTINASESVGIAFLIVNAKDESVVKFYGKFGFQRVAGKPLKLWIPMKTLRKLPQQLAP